MKRRNKSKIFSLNLSSEVRKSIWGIIFVFVAIFLVFSLLGFGGKGGNALSKVLDLFFGAGSWLIVILLILQGSIFFFSKRPSPYSSTIAGGVLLIISVFSFCELCSENLGGSFGKLLVSLPKSFFGIGGSWVFFIALFLISLTFLFNSPIIKKSFLLIFSRKKKEEEELLGSSSLEEGEAEICVKEILPNADTEHRKEKSTKTGVLDIIKQKETKVRYKSLPLALLEREEDRAIAGNLRANAQIIKRTLKNFGIDVEMGEVNIGPTVTQYSLKPAEGVKLARILALQNDLALALASHPIRIEAPVPGKSLVGIEIPNQRKAEVKLANLLSAPEFLSLPTLSIPMGKDVMGKPVFSDCASMPHLLVAGATGSGKTVFLNSLILSLLWRNSPQNINFILIDPKRVEFTSYASLPHLLCPPITQYQKVIPVLKHLIGVMEERFSMLREVGQRDIVSYNKIVEKQEAEQRNNKGKEQETKIKKLPYIVLIIDELADIMMAKGKEFEASVIRLAQMSRAVGIHLVLATQRPSVEVITGLIKANITSRVAFQVASQIDSRTILDMAGAERLLGKGDMLFLSGEAAKPRRIQAPFVSSNEINKVVEYIHKTEKEGERKEKEEEEGEEKGGIKEGFKEVVENVFDENENIQLGEEKDELYGKATEVILQAKKASASFLQRRLKIGYSRAARILDELEEEKIIGPPQGSRPREVLIENAKVLAEKEEKDDIQSEDKLQNDKSKNENKDKNAGANINTNNADTSLIPTPPDELDEKENEDDK